MFSSELGSDGKTNCISSVLQSLDGSVVLRTQRLKAMARPTLAEGGFQDHLAGRQVYQPIELSVHLSFFLICYRLSIRNGNLPIHAHLQIQVLPCKVSGHVCLNACRRVLIVSFLYNWALISRSAQQQVVQGADLVVIMVGAA